MLLWLRQSQSVGESQSVRSVTLMAISSTRCPVGQFRLSIRNYPGPSRYCNNRELIDINTPVRLLPPYSDQKPGSSPCPSGATFSIGQRGLRKATDYVTLPCAVVVPNLPLSTRAASYTNAACTPRRASPERQSTASQCSSRRMRASRSIWTG